MGRLYQIGEAIGDGKFGVVYTCSQRGSGRVYALKVVDKGAMQEMMAKSSSGGQDHQAAGGQQRRSPPPMSSNSANTEAAILKRISHPNIVKIYDHFEYVDQSYLVLELFKVLYSSSKTLLSFWLFVCILTSFLLSFLGWRPL